MKIQAVLSTATKSVYIFDEKDIRAALMHHACIAEQPGKKVEFEWDGHYGNELTATLTVIEDKKKDET
jgi:hypothetical protein